MVSSDVPTLTLHTHTPPPTPPSPPLPRPRATSSIGQHIRDFSVAAWSSSAKRAWYGQLNLFLLTAATLGVAATSFALLMKPQSAYQMRNGTDQLENDVLLVVLGGLITLTTLPVGLVGLALLARRYTAAASAPPATPATATAAAFNIYEDDGGGSSGDGGDGGGDRARLLPNGSSSSSNRAGAGGSRRLTPLVTHSSTGAAAAASTLGACRPRYRHTAEWPPLAGEQTAAAAISDRTGVILLVLYMLAFVLACSSFSPVWNYSAGKSIYCPSPLATENLLEKN